MMYNDFRKVEAEYGTERFLKKGFMGVRSAWYRIDDPFFPKSLVVYVKKMPQQKTKS